MNLFGWDVLSACSQDKLNAMLTARQSAAQPKLTYADPSQGLKISADFAPWQIMALGSNRRLRLALPIKTGSIASASFLAAAPVVALDGVTVEISIDLAFITDATGSTSGLTFNFVKPARDATDTSAGAIVIEAADTTGTLARVDPSGMAATQLAGAFAACLVANKDQLGFVLAEVTLKAVAGADWLVPVSHDYVFLPGGVVGGVAQPGAVVLLALLQAPTGAAPHAQVDQGLVSGVHDISLALAPGVFLQHAVMPALPASFVGATAASFAMSGDQITETMPLICQTVTNAGTGYTPILTSFRMSIAGSTLTVTCKGMFVITGLGQSNVTFSITQDMTVMVFPLPGTPLTGTLMLVANGPPVTDHDTHITPGYWALGVIFAPFVGPIMALVVIAVIDGVIAGVTAAVTSKVTTTGSTAGIGVAPMVALNWLGAGALTLQEAELDNGLVLRGALV